MDKCMGCLGIAWGSRKRRNRLKYRINYGNDHSAGVEFENLVLEDEDRPMNYGTSHHFVSQEEKEILARREYDRILEQQKKIDEQINRQTFEEEERLKIEEERFREAQEEASRAVTAALKVQDLSRSGMQTRNRPDHNLYSIGDSDDSEEDFESFLNSVRERSDEFRSNKTDYVNSVAPAMNNNVVSTQPKKLDYDSLAPDFPRPREFDGVADGMSSDESFSYDQPNPQEGSGEMEWDKFVDGLESEEIEPRKRSATEIHVLKKTAEEITEFT